MRAFATFITTAALAISVLTLTSCGIMPKSQADNRAELDKLKGPDVGSIEASLLSQAQQAETDGNYSQAADTYRQLVDKAPDNKTYASGYAEDLRRAGDDDDALTVAEKLLKKDPANVQAMETKAFCLMDKGNNTQAGNEFGAVMKIDDKRWRTLNGIGILFAMKNRDEDAQAYYQAALAQSPDNPSVLNNIGLAYAMDKQYDRAFESFNHAKQHLPSNSPFLKRIDLNLALVYAITGDLDQAEQTAAPYLSKAALYNNMATYAHLAKNDDLSKSYLNMALTQSPVYYERAWKNLSAMNGEFSDESNANEDKPVARIKLPSKDDSQKSEPAPAAAGITLDEIPESRSKAE